MAETWTVEQHAAITESRHLLLAANAGTGKTATVVGKILWRLGLAIQHATDGPVPGCDDPCELHQIAAITFTEKAAQDLRRKLGEALNAHGIEPGELDRAFVGTIHGFCGEILRQHALRLDIDPSYRVMDARESSLRLWEVLRETVLDAVEAGERDVVELLKDAPLDRYDPHSSAVTDFVRSAMRDLRWHRARYEEWFENPTGPEPRDPALDLPLLRSLVGEPALDPTDNEESEQRYLEHTAAVFRLGYRALGRWLSLLEQENRRDFDSLVLDVRRLLTHDRFQPALDALRRRYRLLVVDEFQDTDTAQRDIVFAIGGVTGANEPQPEPSTQLFLVGDPKQSIYGFRGADVRVWNQVETKFRHVGTVRRLGWNFRSDPALVDLVNRSCEPAFQGAGEALSEADASAVVPYDPLDPAVEPWNGAGIDWLAVKGGGKADETLHRGAVLAAARIEAMLRPDSGERIPGPDGERRVQAGDIAILALRRKTLAAVEQSLRDRGIPTWNAASSGLAERQEVLDAITALRLADNPQDDLRAFAFLRSPFVGLRDEVIARIQLDRALSGDSLLRRSERWLEGIDAGHIEPFESPEHASIEPTERFALRRGLEAVREAAGLVGRTDPADILETLLSRTAYRIHLRFRDGSEEPIANLERLKSLLDEFRSLSLADFLFAWDRAAADREASLAAGPLPSGATGSVFLTTIHSSKGLEWPIVILAGAEDGKPRQTLGRWTGWTDQELGPVLLPPSAERGVRSKQAEQKRRLEEEAEETRLMYVALTRARHRLMVVAPSEDPKGHAGWISRALFTEEGPTEEGGRETTRAAGDARPSVREPIAGSDDPGTGTGRQLDAFGLHDPADDGTGQLNLLNPGNHRPDSDGRSGGDVSSQPIALTVWRNVEPIQQEFGPTPVCLDWLSRIERTGEPADIGPWSGTTAGSLRSATELELERTDTDEWTLRYVHGVMPASRFAGPDDRRSGSGSTRGRRSVDPSIPARLRGLIVHEVLERAERDLSLDRLLDEAIGGVGDAEPGLVVADFDQGARARLRMEIDAVLSGDPWRDWVAGEHHRELPFVHLAGADDWRQGRIDLFVPPRDTGKSESGEVRIVDFKTDRIGPEELSDAAGRYETQTRIYREAVEAILGIDSGNKGEFRRVRVTLHFTHPNRQFEV